jgi:glycosyltransferase involved in cell wall biosynthesis
MRILYLSYSPQDSITRSGSNARGRFPWIDSLLDELLKRPNITLAVAVPVNGESLQKLQENIITIYGLPDHRAKNIFAKIYGRITNSIENLDVNSSALEAIADFNPDIIQVFGTENPFGLIPEGHGKPVIIHIQGFVMVCAQKWFSGISAWEQIRYSGFKELLFMYGSFAEYYNFRKKAEREEAVMKRCRYFLGRTAFDKRIVSLISPASEYFHCEEFIRKIFLESKWDLQLTDEITLISILKGTTYKGIDLLTETMIILQKYSSVRLKLKICGVAEGEEVVKIVKRKYRKHFSTLPVEFTGRLSAEGLASQLLSANFYIHPSYVENSPNSVCEAMALGMPVIATNVGGMNSMITDKVDGVLVQEGEPYTLAAAIVNLINNYEYAKLLGTNARKRSLERHDPEQIAKQLISIYETILNK